MYENISQVGNRINSNYEAIKKIEKLWNENLSIEEQLTLISICGLFYSEYVTGKYSSHNLEKILYKLGNSIHFKRDKAPIENNYLIVMTKAGNIGGHSVIANNWIMWDKRVKYSIAFTDSDEKYVPDFLKSAVKISKGKLYCLKGTYLDKAKELLQISQSYSKIILLQHMNDIVPNLAYSNINWDYPILLYNHANFKFSFGYEVSDIVLNILRYDSEKTINYRGLKKEKSIFLQSPNVGRIISSVPIETKKNNKNSSEKENIADKYGFNYKDKILVSMGDAYKFNDILNCSFFNFVEKLVKKRNDIQYIIIGPSSNEKKWHDLEKNTNGKVRTLGYISRAEAERLIRNCDLYIASFPMISYGANVADENDIPYLTMSLTGREKEIYNNNIALNVEELLQKSNEILDGNIEKYRGTYYKKILNQEQWCSEWHKIADSITVHKGQQIYPQRLIGTEEIVNCQLMQEKAGENVKRLLPQFKLTPQIMRTLLEINEKYEMDCIPEEFTVIDYKTYQQQNELLQQKIKLLEYSNKWLNLNLKGYHIKNYFQDRGIKSIAIYGMGQIGLNLFEELKESSVAVECFIDKVAYMLNAPIKIIGLDKKPIWSRTIVTTVEISEKQLRKDYVCLTDEYEIVSLFNIIDTFYS